MLQPKKTKHRKVHRSRNSLKGVNTRNTRVSFGTYGLKAKTASEVTSRQIEAARRAMTRYVKRGGKIWIKIFPQKIVTTKSSEVPMGSGKGAPDYWVAEVRPGTVMFEMEGVDVEIAREAMRLAAAKLPMKCTFIDSNVM